MPFILIIGWTTECTVFPAMHEPKKTFPGYFSFAFLTLIGLEAHPCGPAGSVFHNKAKNMPAMFSLAQSVSYMKVTALLSLRILVHLGLHDVPLLPAPISRPMLCF